VRLRSKISRDYLGVWEKYRSTNNLNGNMIGMKEVEATTKISSISSFLSNLVPWVDTNIRYTLYEILLLLQA